MIRKLIEQIGLDRIVITGFRIIQVNIDKLKRKKEVVFEDQGNEKYLLDNGDEFSKLKIIDNVWFGTLIAGTKKTKYGKHDYSRMDINIGNQETGNLQNMTVEEYKNKIHHIFSYLYEEYGILAESKEIRIATMEINATFAIKDEFYKYHRALRLMMYNLPDYYLKITEVEKKNKKKSRLESETFYRGNQSMQIKIYDKKRQLQYAKGFTTDNNIMRIEFVLKNAQKIREVFHSNFLNDLTDEKVNDFYIMQFRKLFEKKYLDWRKTNGSRIKQMIISHKNRHCTRWQINLLNECRNFEQTNRIPILLEINDLLEQVKLLEQNRHYNRIEKSILNKCELNDVYLQNDSKKVEEILDTVNRIYQNHKEEMQSERKGAVGGATL